MKQSLFLTMGSHLFPIEHLLPEEVIEKALEKSDIPLNSINELTLAFSYALLAPIRSFRD